MKLVGLISGGKDSLYNMLQCISAGHEIVAVANIEPETKAELDSYMYQSVGHEAVALIAGALNLPIFRTKTKGKAICRSKTYTGTTLDEVEDLYLLLAKVKKNLEIEGVSVGAIASDYQRTRVENVCLRLGLRCFAYLWRRDQSELLQEMIEANVDAIIIKVASIGLHPEIHLGMHIKDALPYLFELNRKFGVNICGEGGEYETLTLDCPLFHRLIEISESENVILSDDAFAPVGTLNVKNATLKSKGWKSEDPVISARERLKYIQAHIKDPYAFVQDCVDEISENLFPQKPTKNRPDIPFPFEDVKRDSDALSTNLQEYWKKSQSKRSASQSSVRLTPSGSLISADTSRSSLSYITGWCCMCNITGTSIQDALSCLQKNLERTTYTTQDIVFVNVFVRNMSDFANMNKAYSQFMPEVLPPARSCIGTFLPPEIGFILHVVAHKVVSRSQKAVHALYNQERDAMHVQSISHWAPANIGPYSQCVKIGGLYYLSGQIPLIPGTMEILNKPIFHQSRLTIRHLQRVLQAMDESLSYDNIFQAVCYLTAQECAPDICDLWNYVTMAEHTTIAVIVVNELPRNAQIEWEVVACSYKNPEVEERNEILDDFNLQMKRCHYRDPFTSSVVCKVTYLRKSKSSEKVLKVITPKIVQDFIKLCHEFLRSGAKTFAMPLCMLKCYYKPFDSSTAFSIYDLTNMSLDSKVVCSMIPVVAFNNPEVIVTITGLCH